jgi:crotonobetainyl-CoA:carnitine CoA-transferase CaiB-like acyl-CoA transferase
MNWDELKVTGLCLNLPGPMLLQHFSLKGAQVNKVEPLMGDPLQAVYPKWYEEIHKDINVQKLDLKQTQEIQKLKRLLQDSDIFITTARPKALKKMGLGPDELLEINPKLFHLGLIGHAHPHEDVPGHDLTYQAHSGILPDDGLPRSLFVDILGTEMAWSELLIALLEKKTGTIWHALESAAEKFRGPLEWGATKPKGILGGGSPFYQVYNTKNGRVAVACLEPHFQKILCAEFGVKITVSYNELQEKFSKSTAEDWHQWALKHEVPMTKVLN